MSIPITTSPAARRLRAWLAMLAMGQSDRLFVAFVALVASVAGLLNDFVYDDIPLIQENLRAHSFAHWYEVLTRPYWPPPFVEQLYRPLSSLLLTTEYVLGFGSPLAFRLVSYALYVACALAVHALALRLLPKRAALAVALLFAVHPVHVEAVALGVNQGELLVGLFAVAMVCRYLDRRRDGALALRDWAYIAVLYAAAALTKENGFVLPGLLIVTELLLPFDGTSARARVIALWRGYALLAIVGASLLWLRSAVLSSTEIGAVAARALTGLGIGDRIALMLQVVPMWLRLFAWPAHLRADYAPHEIVVPTSFGLPEAAGIALVIGAFALILAARRVWPVVAFGMAWCVVALLPVSNLIPTGIVLAERTLFTPSIGFLIAAVALMRHVTSGETSIAAHTRRVLPAACAALLVLGVIRSANRHHVWNTSHLIVISPAGQSIDSAGVRGTPRRAND